MISWLVTQLLYILHTFTDSVRWFGGVVWSGALGVLAGLFPTVDWASWTATLGKVNTVFPLSELVAMGAVCGAVWSFVLVYKVIKSWIPTVSGG